MRRTATMVTAAAAAVVLFAAGLQAQGKPNFTGKWTIDPASAPQGGGGGGGGGRGGRGGGGGWGQTFTLTQDATTLKVERMQGEATVTETYKLDGSDSKNSMPGRQGGAPTEVVSKAAWDGDKIVITSSRTVNMQGTEMKIDVKRVISMAGADLQIDTTTTGMGDTPMTATVKYKKG